MDRRIYLKVKIKSLAEEAKIIRKEEGRAKHFRDGLHNHRVVDVRREQRATLLAYGFLRGKSHKEIENSLAVPDYIQQRVRSMVSKYGEPKQGEGLTEWFGATYKEWRAARVAAQI